MDPLDGMQNNLFEFYFLYLAPSKETIIYPLFLRIADFYSTRGSFLTRPDRFFLEQLDISGMLVRKLDSSRDSKNHELWKTLRTTSVNYIIMGRGEYFPTRARLFVKRPRSKPWLWSKRSENGTFYKFLVFYRREDANEARSARKPEKVSLPYFHREPRSSCAVFRHDERGK